MTGLHLSQYRIDAELGRGGMGIVYKATDTKLNRTVALKVLPAAALSSEDDRARFVREAQSAAQLHHPNIATVFGIDEAVPVEPGKEPQPGTETRLFIAMEYIEGETVREVVEKGPLKLQDAVNIAGQVAEALKEAHAKQIVHRDIKSANVMLTSQGVAKVLDFGLAKTNQSTMLTRMGSTLGTVAYMSPEQARGHEVDGRTDLYSLGTMLYEMVAGKLPFAGDYEQAVLYGIMNEPPEPLTAMRTGVPMELERIVAKLLSKEAEYRYQTAGDLLADLKSLSLGGSGVSRRSMAAVPGTKAVPVRSAVLPIWVYGAIATALIIGAAGAWIAKPQTNGEQPPVRRLTTSFAPVSPIGRLSISADGRALASVFWDEEGYRGVIRYLDEPGIRELELTQSAAPVHLSPDARWLAYEADDQLRRMSTSGGLPEAVADLEGLFTTWLSDSEVITSTWDALWSITGTNEPVRLEVPIDSGAAVIHPFRIPGTNLLLFTRYGSSPATSSVHVFDLDSGRSERIVDRAVWPRYHPSGFVLFFRGQDVHAASFDVGSWEVGPSFLVQAGVDDINDGVIVMYDISQTDLLAYYPLTTDGLQGRELVTQSGQGVVTPFNVERKDYWDPRVSPDGRRILTHLQTNGEPADIWLIDPERRTVRRMTTQAGEEETAVWAPDGLHFYYSADDDEGEYVLRQTLDGSAPLDTVFSTTAHIHVESVSSDDRSLVVMLRSGSGSDLWLIDRQDSAGTRALLSTPADEAAGKISPDGRIMAYQSNETGRDEVYLAAFPEVLGVQVVSVDGGTTPVWSRDGQYLYYDHDGVIMRLPVSGGEPGLAEPYTTLSASAFRQNPHTTFDVVDGAVVYVNAPGSGSARQTVQLITGLPTLLRSLDPARDGG